MDTQKLRQQIEKAIEPHLPLIQAQLQLAAQNAGQQLNTFVQDEEKLRSALAIVHGSLPLAARFIVKEQRFVDFCVRHKDKLIPPAIEDENHKKM